MKGFVDIKEFILTKCSFIQTYRQRMMISTCSLSEICNYMFGYSAFSKTRGIYSQAKKIKLVNKLSICRIIHGADDAIYGYYAFLQCILNVNNSRIDY